MSDAGPLCLRCADLDHLVYLPAGDAALTRRARTASGLSAVVVRFSRARRRHERQGVLVESEALDQAEAQCLADADARARRRVRERARREAQDAELRTALADEIVGMFPGCPASGRPRSRVTRRCGAAGASGEAPPGVPSSRARSGWP